MYRIARWPTVLQCKGAKHPNLAPPQELKGHGCYDPHVAHRSARFDALLDDLKAVMLQQAQLDLQQVRLQISVL